MKKFLSVFVALLTLWAVCSSLKAEEPVAQPGDELPLVDISRDAWRQTVIAEGTPDVYQGHPTTLLLNDGQTLFCVWTFQHGGPCGPMAKSEDGGKTWVRQDEFLPEVYGKTHRNCPTLQRIVSPDGKTERFFIFSSKGGKLGSIVSEDQGKTWREVEPANLSAGMPPTGLIRLKDGTTALFGQVRNDPKVKTDRAADDQSIWMAVTSDGGFTWSEPRVVATADQKNLCEPFVLRSDDGNELCLLMRENRHTDRSMMCFSRDEGKTWTKPENTCWGLCGDRHEGIQAPDGRWVIAFRDRAPGSSTYGQFVAWVGTYDDIRNGKPGQFRIHLLQHFGEKGWASCDTGYSGMELLADGSILATTYTKHWPDARKHSVVCTRFKLDEIVKEPFLKPWAEGVPYPMASEIAFPEGAEHVIVQDCDADPDYGFLHETSIGQLDGELIVGWYNNPKSELSGKTIQRARRSKDFFNWSELETVQDLKNDEGLMYVGLQFFTLDGKLYCFTNQEHGAERPTECLLQVWEPETKTWKILGPIAGRFLSMQPPILMENGNYAISGSLMPPTRDINGTTPVVFISRGKEIQKPWRMVRIDPETDYVNVFAETGIVVDGPNLLAVTRLENCPFPNFYESNDFGETWRKIENRTFAASNSKFAAGTFSNGYRYIVYNLPGFKRTADGKIDYKTDANGKPTTEGIGMGRGTLVIAVAKPGEKAFSAIWKVSDRTALTEQGASHYPTVLEYNGFVYISYTGNHKLRNCGVTRFPLKSLEQ